MVAEGGGGRGWTIYKTKKATIHESRTTKQTKPRPVASAVPHPITP